MADRTDANLVNPWGIARSGGSPWWVNDNGTGVSEVFDAAGNPFPANHSIGGNAAARAHWNRFQ